MGYPEYCNQSEMTEKKKGRQQQKTVEEIQIPN